MAQPASPLAPEGGNLEHAVLATDGAIDIVAAPRRAPVAVTLAPGERGVLLLSLLCGSAFVGMNALLIRRINPDPAIGGDASLYISMTRGTLDRIPSPFRFRFLVPRIAEALPFSPGHSLMAITYGSLVVMFVAIAYTSYRINRDAAASIFATCLVFSSRWFMYNFENPYLADAFALAALSIAFSCLMGRAYSLFSRRSWSAVSHGRQSSHSRQRGR